MDQQTTPKIMLGKPVQIGLVVKDAHRTAELLWSLFGIGPFQFVEWPPPDRPDMRVAFYNGKPGHWRMRLAFANLGNIEMELAEPIEGENGYADALAERGEGLHHLLFEVPDFDAAVATFAEMGIGVKMGGTGLRPGTNWVHLDTIDLLGWVVELRSKLPESDGTTPVPPTPAGQ